MKKTTPIQSGGEAMPGANRRAFMTKAGVGAALVAVAAVPAAAAFEPDHPWAKVHRLADELADALDVWIDGFKSERGPRPDWDALVSPASSGRGCHFRNRKVACVETIDPLRDLIVEYRKQTAAFAAIPDEVLTKATEAGYTDATYGPSMDRLLNDTPETTSLAGVREAIRLAFEEDALECRLSENALRSALAYLDWEARP